jgi:hypothetical protein
MYFPTKLVLYFYFSKQLKLLKLFLLLQKMKTMIQSEKKLAGLSKILKQNNELLIIEAINLLREEQPFEGVIFLLSEYYDKTDHRSVKRTIESFINDIKDTALCNEIITEINRGWQSHTTSMLVSSCWQSGLDYSKNLEDFAKAFMSGDYVVAVECLTVIEEMLPKIGKDETDSIRKIIENSVMNDGLEKTELRKELITSLKR